MTSSRRPPAEVVAVVAAALGALVLGEGLRSLDPCSSGEVARPLRLLLGLALLPLAVALGAGRVRVHGAGLTVVLLVVATAPRPGPAGYVDCYVDASAWALTTPVAWSGVAALVALGALLGLLLRRSRGPGAG